MYIFDDAQAIITSANLTNGGLITNYEYGIFTDDKQIVGKICQDFQSLSKNTITGIVKKEHISKAYEILAKIPKIELPNIPTLNIETPEYNFDVIERATHSIDSSLTGWTLKIFQYLVAIPKQEFTLYEVYLFESNLSEIYPNNQNIRAKIRQQIQFLRDLGLIEFLTTAKYRKLWKS